MKTCKFCNKKVEESHYCEEEKRTIDYDDSTAFITSLALGMALDNGIVGGLIGGDIGGGILGDLLNGGDLF